MQARATRPKRSTLAQSARHLPHVHRPQIRWNRRHCVPLPSIKAERSLIRDAFPRPFPRPRPRARPCARTRPRARPRRYQSTLAIGSKQSNGTARAPHSWHTRLMYQAYIKKCLIWCISGHYQAIYLVYQAPYQPDILSEFYIRHFLI